MPQNKDLKRLVRARMAASGELGLHFGMLLRGGGAVDLARPSFGVAAATTPVTVTADQDGLPDEPQAFDFG